MRKIDNPEMWEPWGRALVVRVPMKSQTLEKKQPEPWHTHNRESKSLRFPAFGKAEQK